MCKNSINFRHTYTFCAKKTKKEQKSRLLDSRTCLGTEQQKNMIFFQQRILFNAQCIMHNAQLFFHYEFYVIAKRFYKAKRLKEFYELFFNNGLNGLNGFYLMHRSAQRDACQSKNAQLFFHYELYEFYEFFLKQRINRIKRIFFNAQCTMHNAQLIFTTNYTNYTSSRSAFTKRSD